MTTNDLDAALAALRERLPEMGGAAAAFAALVRAGDGLELDGETWPPYAEFDAEAFQGGRPLLAGLMNSRLEALFIDCAQAMLPAIRSRFPALAGYAGLLDAALENLPHFASRCVTVALSEEEKSLDQTAEIAHIPAPALLFLARESLKPCLRRAARCLAPLADDALWCKPHCPVCGSRPDMGSLRKKDDASEFLITKSGLLWLHCSLCGHEWRFMRLVCPSCGQQDHERLEVLTVEDRPGERVHVCLDCKRYLPVADLTAQERPLNMDIAPLGLVHLDILAQERGYKPMVSTPWNTFG